MYFIKYDGIVVKSLLKENMIKALKYLVFTNIANTVLVRLNCWHVHKNKA